MGPSAIAQVLKDYGASGVAALCVVAMVAMFWRLSAVQSQLVVELKAAQERETAALRTVLPVVERMQTAIAVLERPRQRRASDGTNPGVPNPLLRDVK